MSEHKGTGSPTLDDLMREQIADYKQLVPFIVSERKEWNEMLQCWGKRIELNNGSVWNLIPEDGYYELEQ